MKYTLVKLGLAIGLSFVGSGAKATNGIECNDQSALYCAVLEFNGYPRMVEKAKLPAPINTSQTKHLKVHFINYTYLKTPYLEMTIKYSDRSTQTYKHPHGFNRKDRTYYFQLAPGKFVKEVRIKSPLWVGFDGLAEVSIY